MRRFGRGNRDDGASLIEFALIMPLLVLLLLGTVDAGWAFFQNLEVRHGAREAARLAAVSAAPDFDTAQEIIDETCARMNTSSPDVTVILSGGPGADLLLGTGDDEAPGLVGDSAQVEVKRQHSSLTGLLPFFDNVSLHSMVEIRLEQDATWANLSDTCAP